MSRPPPSIPPPQTEEGDSLNSSPPFFKEGNTRGGYAITVLVFFKKVFTAKTTTPSESRNRKTSTAIKM